MAVKQYTKHVIVEMAVKQYTKHVILEMEGTHFLILSMKINLTELQFKDAIQKSHFNIAYW